MKARDRVLAALESRPVDRVPVTSMMTGVTKELMDACGVYWPQAHEDARQMVELAASAAVHAGLETMKLPFDMAVEAEALGAAINLGDTGTLPQVSGHVLQWPDVLQIPQEILSRGRIPMILEAIQLAKARYGEDIAVVSSIVGPFTLAGKLYSLEDLLIGTLEEPDTMRALLAAVTDLCILYARAQVEAGADIVQIGEAGCSGDLISAQTYGDFIAPEHKRLCAAIPAPCVVHICGNITGHLPHIAQTGMTAISFDAKTDPVTARQVLSGKVKMIGWVDTLDVLLKGDVQAVYDAAVSCINQGVDLLNAGCAWPPDVPLENIRAMVRAANDCGRWK